MKTRRTAFAALALVTFGALALVPAVADAKLSKTGDGAIGRVRAAGPAGLSIVGTTSDVSVADDGTTVVVDVKLDALSTGISLRDKHAKNYLEVATYPSATLKVARAALKFPEAGKSAEADAKGSFTLHGQTKDVTFHYSAKRDGDVFSVKGTLNVNMTDYGIKTPSYLGVGVKPDVVIETEFKAKDAS